MGQQNARLRIGEPRRRVSGADALTQRLTAAERDRSHPPIRVRDAASLILLDRSGPSVLMGRRSARHTFMPNRFVFPGGRVDPHDSRVKVAKPYDPVTRDKLLARMRNGRGDARARALGVAALRETYEETGVLVGEPGGVCPSSADIWQGFGTRSLGLDLSALRFVARAITPPGRPRRFDTRFFVVEREAIADIDPHCVGPDAELEEIAWVAIEEAKTMPLPTITLTVLDELLDRLRADTRLPPDGPVPFYHWRPNGFVREIL